MRIRMGVGCRKIDKRKYWVQKESQRLDIKNVKINLVQFQVSGVEVKC